MAGTFRRVRHWPAVGGQDKENRRTEFANERGAAPLREREKDEYAFEIVLGTPLVAGDPDRLRSAITGAGADLAVHALFPGGCRAEIVPEGPGFCFRVLVPVPNDLPDLLPVPPPAHGSEY